ncbi:hypothetical protein D3C80_1210860 [compost metagenome]
MVWSGLQSDQGARFHLDFGGGQLLDLGRGEFGMAERHQGDVVRVLSQEEGLAGAVGVATDHADPFVQVLISVADGAIAKHPRSDRRLMNRARQIDLVEVYPRSENDGPALSGRAVLKIQAKPAGYRFDCSHLRLFHDRAILDSMARHARDQVGSPNTIGKSWSIVREGNPERAAGPVVQHERGPTVSRQVEGCCQACGPGADDDDIASRDHFFSHRQETISSCCAVRTNRAGLGSVSGARAGGAISSTGAGDQGAAVGVFRQARIDEAQQRRNGVDQGRQGADQAALRRHR